MKETCKVNSKTTQSKKELWQLSKSSMRMKMGMITIKISSKCKMLKKQNIHQDLMKSKTSMRIMMQNMTKKNWATSRINSLSNDYKLTC